MAIACRCFTQLMDPESASTISTAFFTEPAVMMSRGFRFDSIISTIRRPAARTWFDIFGDSAETGVAARERHAERFANDVHRVRGAHAGADAGTPNGDVGHGPELLDGDAARRDVAGFQEHLFDVDVLAAILAALLIPQMTTIVGMFSRPAAMSWPRRRLVARRETHHAVEQCAFDLHFDVGGDQVARGQDVCAAAARARDEVAWRRRAHLERQSTRGADRGFELSSLRRRDG